jgi:hypothetical protein
VQIPTTNSIPTAQCISWENYNTLQAVCNISSDGFMILIPLSLFVRTSYPIKQKVFLCVVFGMGIFVVSGFLNLSSDKSLTRKLLTAPIQIACAITNKINMDGEYYQFWDVREVSAAVRSSYLPLLFSSLLNKLKLQRC